MPKAASWTRSHSVNGLLALSSGELADALYVLRHRLSALLIIPVVILSTSATLSRTHQISLQDKFTKSLTAVSNASAQLVTLAICRIRSTTCHAVSIALEVLNQ